MTALENSPQVMSLLPLDPLLPGASPPDRRAPLQPARGLASRGSPRNGGLRPPDPPKGGPSVTHVPGQIPMQGPVMLP